MPRSNARIRACVLSSYLRPAWQQEPPSAIATATAHSHAPVAPPHSHKDQTRDMGGSFAGGHARHATQASLTKSRGHTYEGTTAPSSIRSPQGTHSAALLRPMAGQPSRTPLLHLSGCTGSPLADASAQQQPFFASAGFAFCAMTMPDAPGRGCGVFFGSLRAIATKSSLTLDAVLALVSMKKMPLSLAYDSASCSARAGARATRRGALCRMNGMGGAPASARATAPPHQPRPRTRARARTSGSTLRFELKSALLPASAITMFGLPCL